MQGKPKTHTRLRPRAKRRKSAVVDSPTEPICAIVRLLNGVQHPAVRFQVTIRPDQLKDEYIRFGNTREDELVGWFRLEDLHLEKILGLVKLNEDGKTATVTPLKSVA